MINLRDLSVRCGRCSNYMTLSGYETRAGWNAYTFECDGGGCEPAASRTVIEIPTEIDEFARKHPDCGGGCGGR